MACASERNEVIVVRVAAYRGDVGGLGDERRASAEVGNQSFAYLCAHPLTEPRTLRYRFELRNQALICDQFHATGLPRSYQGDRGGPISTRDSGSNKHTRIDDEAHLRRRVSVPASGVELTRRPSKSLTL